MLAQQPQNPLLIDQKPLDNAQMVPNPPDFKGLGGIGKKLVAPLVVLGLADLVLGANLGHWLALQALNENHRFGLGVPFASVQG
jgi:hypothetical protein